LVEERGVVGGGVADGVIYYLIDCFVGPIAGLDEDGKHGEQRAAAQLNLEIWHKQREQESKRARERNRRASEAVGL
jgi:hypothetical protein